MILLFCIGCFLFSGLTTNALATEGLAAKGLADSGLATIGLVADAGATGDMTAGQTSSGRTTTHLSAIESSATASTNVYLLEINGVINPVVSEYISQELKSAQPDIPVIIQLNTPGGLMESMNEIVMSILNSPRPVIVWVGPAGAKAASAGVFITMASDIAAMAPATNIGAAHPVQMGGVPIPSRPSGGEQKKEVREKDGQREQADEKKGEKIKPGADKPVQYAPEPDTMEQKITNDAAAYMRAITKTKKRNWQWAEESVTKSVSITSDEALRKKVIEYVAPDLNGLLSMIHGKKVEKLDRTYVLNTKDASVIKKEMSAFRKFLNFVAHPNIALIFLTLGVYGLIYEFSSPGIGFGVVFGGVCLILAFYSMHLLPVNTAGLVLVLLGVVLMAMDIIVSTYGILTIGGVASFIFGSLMLFDSPENFLRVSFSVIFSLAAATLLFIVFVIGAILKSRRKKVATGRESLLGTVAVARNDFVNSQGMVFVHGELWKAETPGSGEVKTGEKLEITGIEGNLLKVKKASG
ncbi:MAG: nodulation protein NfeD [Elusimicrobiota bacterium]